MVILDFLEKYKLDSKKIFVNILRCCVTCHLGGTSAELLENDSLSIHELLHGMMLPSGNDAAQALAIYFGNLQLMIKNQNANPHKTNANINLEEYLRIESKDDKEKKSSSDLEDKKETQPTTDEKLDEQSQGHSILSQKSSSERDQQDLLEEEKIPEIGTDDLPLSPSSGGCLSEKPPPKPKEKDDGIDHDRLNVKVAECLKQFYEMMN